MQLLAVQAVIGLAEPLMLGLWCPSVYRNKNNTDDPMKEINNIRISVLTIDAILLYSGPCQNDDN
jgi:hypothetical protein